MTYEEDKDLIKKALSGERAAFDALIERHYDMMYSLAYRWCGNREDAEDITHNAFLKVSENLQSFRSGASFKTWLYRIVVNTANDWHRKKKVRRVFPADLTQMESPSRTDDNLQAMEILEIIDRLPRGERDALILVSGHGLSHAEAGEILGCRESTISWRLHEARKKIKDQHDG